MAQESDPPMQGENIPVGYCQCGCGEPTTIATKTDPSTDRVKGRPMRFRRGHSGRTTPEEYRVDLGTGCWIWQRSTTPRGYGHIRVGDKMVRAHRVYYERERGPIPEGLELDHLCRNQACVNPAHLEPVSHPVNVQRGLTAKLTPSAVQEIRASADQTQVLAVRYGVSQSAILRARARATWKEVA